MNGSATTFGTNQLRSPNYLFGATHTPLSTPFRSNQTVAQEVANLFRQGRQGEAVALLNNHKQGQAPAVQQALDRMVSAELQYSISPDTSHNNQNLFASPAEIGTAIRQINQAGSQTPEMPVTSTLSDQQKFDVYASIVQTRGDQAARDDLANGNSVIVGLRSETGSLENHGRGVYDDRIAVISREANGTVHVEEFNRVSTEPSAQYDANLANHPDNRFRRSVGEDVTGDGIRDQGRLAAPQTIQMYEDTHRNPASAGGSDFALRPTPQSVNQGQGGVERFTAGTGYVDNSNPGTSDDLNRTFKIHSGSRTNTDSAGCTTVHPNDYVRFEESIRTHPGQTTWNYVLTEVTP
ncbi:MAG: hypothetical protein JAY99_00445 [Candidatus Thiodiazotropha lotti]|nr:hypothetical protein [Candidatus Thiodiazotropha lotti]MCG7997975.1 hypothetical protein [Candidatus Thiodiazotropha lotti]MCW4185170.1 hypothetical protein [Candidatus Thiodiazotropha weberae]MCW4189738.1 hypothetical protein [Candidatus Thiodiazotropha weberae]